LERAAETQASELTQVVIGIAIKLHRELGAGLLESVYQACLVKDLRDAGLRVETEKVLPIRWRGATLDATYRLDAVVEKMLVLELKAVEQVLPIHKAQLLTYLRLSEYPIGLLINFNAPLLRDGITRIIGRGRDSKLYAPP
jgi:GxxExxY protein